MNRAGLLVAALVVCYASPAVAFCTLTTCKDKTETCEIDEKGCNRSGSPLRWPSLPIPFRFSNRRPSRLVREDARAAIRSAFFRWSDTLCGPNQQRTSLRFVEQEDLDADKPLVAGSRATEPFAIFFRDLGWPYEGKEDATLAQTNQMFSLKTGEVQYADMEINSGNMRFSTKEGEEGIDLQAVMTHEVGHYIGLAHSREPDAIMAASYCARDQTRCSLGKVAALRLADDDIAAVCALYPPEGRPDLAPDDDGGCSTGRAAPREAPYAMGASGIVLALSLRRRRAHARRDGT